MKKLFYLLLLPAFSFAQVNNIPVFKGVTNQISIVKKSAATPTCKMKDGSEIKLENDENGIKVIMNKNGATWDFLEQNTDALYAQVGEFDFEKDGKMEIFVAYRMSKTLYDVYIFKKPEFETKYTQWTMFAGSNYCEFPGDGTVKSYAADLTVTIIKFNDDGKQITD